MFLTGKGTGSLVLAMLGLLDNFRRTFSCWGCAGAKTGLAFCITVLITKSSSFHLVHFGASNKELCSLLLKLKVFTIVESGLGSTNKNTVKNSLGSCQTFRLLKLRTNISDSIHMKQFKRTFLDL
jgi:hypothetical protein